MTAACPRCADLTWHEGELQRQAARAVEAERQRDEALTHILELDALIPCDDFEAPPLRTMASPERQKVAGWAIATCARVMRGELYAFPEDTRNRLTIGVVWDDERWSLTLARGDYEHAVAAQRNEARAERDEARRAALRWEGNADQMERERDDAKARARHATQLIIEAIGSVGPESVEDAVPRVLAALDKAHERETALLVRVGYAEERLRLSVAAWDAAGMQGRDAASVIREAQEQGARWAIEAWHRDDLQTGPAAEEAARICAEARKAGEHG